MFLNLLKFVAFANSPSDGAGDKTFVTGKDNTRTMLTVTQFCHRIGIAPATERRYRKEYKDWPQPVMIGKVMAFPIAVVENWEKNLRPANYGQ